MVILLDESDKRHNLSKNVMDGLSDGTKNRIAESEFKLDMLEDESTIGQLSLD